MITIFPKQLNLQEKEPSEYYVYTGGNSKAADIAIFYNISGSNIKKFKKHSDSDNLLAEYL